MDFLSHCPSLVDILKRLSVVDNAKCKLVNRRIRDVIEGNRTTVKPTGGNIDIRYRELCDGRCKYLFICARFCSLTGLCRSAIVTETMILLMNTAQQNQSNCFGFRGVELSESEYPMNSYENMLIARFAGNKGLLAYKNNSVEEGLRQLLSGVLDRCHFESLILDNKVPDSWIKVVAVTFEENRSNCRRLETQLSPGIRPLFETLGCSHLTLIETNNKILEINGWNNVKRLCIFSERNSSAQKAIILFLQEWQNGNLSMNNMILSVHASDLQDSWTDKKIDNLLSKLDLSDVQDTPVNEENISRKIIINRIIDSKTIQLTVREFKLQSYSRIVDFKEL